METYALVRVRTTGEQILVNLARVDPEWAGDNPFDVLRIFAPVNAADVTEQTLESMRAGTQPSIHETLQPIPSAELSVSSRFGAPLMPNEVAPAVATVIPGDDSPIGALLDAADAYWTSRDLGQVRVSSTALENEPSGIRFGTEARIVLPPYARIGGGR